MSNLRRRSLLRASLLVALVTAGMTAACGLRGSGTAASETRRVDPFESLTVSETFTVILHLAPAEEPRVEVTADDNLLPVIVTEVNRGELGIGYGREGVIRPKIAPTIEIWTPSLRAIHGSGASVVTATELAGERLELRLSGASAATLDGAIDHLTIQGSGAVKIDAQKLRAQTVSLTFSGAGEAEIWAEETLEATLSGAVKVGYRGQPETVRDTVSGAAKLTARE